MNIVKKLFFYSIAVILIVGLFHTLAHAQTYDCSYIDSATEYNNCCTDSGGGSSEDCIAYEDQYMANPSTATPQPTTTASNTSSSCSATNITDDNCYIQNCTGGYDPSGDSASCINYANASAMKDDGNTACASINSSNVSSCCGGSESPMCIAYQDQVTGTGGSTGLNTPSTGTTATGTGLIPCTGDDSSPCTVNSVMQLINNVINFFFKTLLLPLFVIMILFLGFGYLTAEGNPAQHAKLKSMAKHMITGLLLMLCAYLIVKTILAVLGFTDPLGFFG